MVLAKPSQLPVVTAHSDRAQELGGAFVEPEGLVEAAVVAQQVVHVLVAKALRRIFLPAAAGAQHDRALPQRRQEGAGSAAHGERASEAAPVEGVDSRRHRWCAQGSAHRPLRRRVEELGVPCQLARGVRAQGAHDLEVGRAHLDPVPLVEGLRGTGEKGGEGDQGCDGTTHAADDTTPSRREGGKEGGSRVSPSSSERTISKWGLRTSIQSRPWSHSGSQRKRRPTPPRKPQRFFSKLQFALSPSSFVSENSTSRSPRNA